MQEGAYKIGDDGMKVAVICEFSGTVRDAFIRAGHEAISFDLLPTEQPGPHRQGDVMELPLEYWKQFDLAICYPECTYLANSGVRWLIDNKERINKMYKAADFFKYMLNLPINKICVENPIQHKYAKEAIGANYTQIIQPWQFGHGETKATCLWLKNLPKLESTNIVDGREARIHKMPPGPDRWKERSRTYKGIAKAMAEQWGRLDE
jgi:hypothetical protein